MVQGTIQCQEMPKLAKKSLSVFSSLSHNNSNNILERALSKYQQPENITEHTQGSLHPTQLYPC